MNEIAKTAKTTMVSKVFKSVIFLFGNMVNQSNFILNLPNLLK